MNKQAGAVVPALPYVSAAATETAFAEHLGPSMVRLMAALGTPIHYGKREGARVQDVYTGKWYWDCHRNGSVYNLGHRNPEVLAAVSEAMRNLEVGNLFLCSGYKAAAAEKLVASTGGALTGIVYAASGAEANEIAIRAARGFTRRRKLVSLKHSYHGSSCFAMAAGDNPEYHERYLLDFPDFIKVPYNDVDAMRAAVDDETSCVLLEASPAQLGFPVPKPGYFEAVRKICDEKGAVFILDEVQTGLGSSGRFWLWQQQGVVPDIVTTAKGLGGGIVANAALLMAPAIKDWFLDTEFPHMSTFGGNELGCVATATVCDITSRPEFSKNVLRLIEQFREGFANAPFHVNQVGLCMGLLSESMDSYEMTRKLFALGILVLPAHYDPHAVEFRPILILNENEAETIIKTVRGVLG
jgi:acetylornithine/succinyldiaminopimelate/putrescine aminotransferase